jgi:hypothetical protein
MAAEVSPSPRVPTSLTSDDHLKRIIGDSSKSRRPNTEEWAAVSDLLSALSLKARGLDQPSWHPRKSRSCAAFSASCGVASEIRRR